MPIYIRDVGYIRSPGVNPHWGVTLGLEDLQGIMKGSVLLIEELDRYIAQRDRGEHPLPDIIGIAISATMITSYAAEIAIKTLIAQTKPKQKPPKSHKLLYLFEQLDQDTQEKVQHTFSIMTPIGQPNWIGAHRNIRQTIDIGNANFIEWRYRAGSRSASNGVPKGLINVAEAVRIVTLGFIIGATGSEEETVTDIV